MSNGAGFEYPMKHWHAILALLLLVSMAELPGADRTVEAVPIAAALGSAAPVVRTQWFMRARYGVMLHFGVGPHNSDLVHQFDVDRLANQLEEIGAGYFLLMLGQNSGYYCSPNAAYDAITAQRPGERCSLRDLPLDLYRALHPRGIKLMLYLPANPPWIPEVRRKFGWEFPSEEGQDQSKRRPRESGRPTQQSLENWCRVIREWSTRYGDKVAGWWIDGAFKECYDNPAVPGQSWICLLVGALKAGNPSALVAFNPGLRNRPYFFADHDDYLAGHDVGANQLSEIPESRFVGHTQWHALVYMGENWGGSKRRFSTEQWMNYCQRVFAKGGVITFDVGVNTSLNSGKPVGTIVDEHLQQLRVIRANR